MSTYVDFIESASESATLANEFTNALKNFSSEKLSSWFREKGYLVSMDTCDSLLKNKKNNTRKIEPGPEPQY